MLLRVRRGTRPQAPPEPGPARADAGRGLLDDLTSGRDDPPAAAAASPLSRGASSTGSASRSGLRAAAGTSASGEDVVPAAAALAGAAAGAAAGAGGGGRRWARLVVLVLLAGLGFGISVSVRSNSGPAGLATARQEDLVRILDTLDSEEERLASELEDLEQARDELAGGAGPAAALDEARSRAEGLAILAGTAPAAGPGIEMVVTDPGLEVGAAVIVDAIQELRDAGAEAIEIGDVRVVAETYVLDSPTGGIFVEQTPLRPPYRLLVIGDGHTLAEAMQIPGGVLDTVANREGATASVEVRERIEIGALRPLPTPRYARPAG